MPQWNNPITIKASIERQMNTLCRDIYNLMNTNPGLKKYNRSKSCCDTFLRGVLGGGGGSQIYCCATAMYYIYIYVNEFRLSGKDLEMIHSIYNLFICTGIQLRECFRKKHTTNAFRVCFSEETHLNAFRVWFYETRGKARLYDFTKTSREKRV